MGDPTQKSGGEIAKMALAIFDKVKDIKTDNPDVAKAIDDLEKEIKERLQGIRDQIERLDKTDRDLVTILVINGIHRSTDEILVD